MARKITRWIVIFLLLGVVGILAIATALYLIVDTKKVTDLICHEANNQTGGVLTIKSMEFSPFFGFDLAGIQFTGPKPDGTPNNNLHPQKLLDFDHIRLNYNLWHLLYGSVDVTNILIDGGRVDLNLDPAASALVGIQAYRLKKFGPPKNATPTPVTTAQPPASLPDQIKLAAKYLKIPIRINIDNIGIKNLDINLNNPKKPNPFMVQFSKLTTLINVTAFASEIDLKLKTELASINTRHLIERDLKADLALKIRGDETTSTIAIDDLRLNILGILAARTKATLKPDSGDKNSIAYDLQEYLTIDLKPNSALSRMLPHSMTTNGSVAIGINDLHGRIDLNRMQDIIAKKEFDQLLPESMQLDLEVRKLDVTWPDKGIYLAPIAMDFKLSQTKNKDTVKLNANIDVDDLAKTSFAVVCERQCEKFSVDHQTTVPSLTTIWTRFNNTIMRFIPAKLQPDKIIGTANFSLKMNGAIDKDLITGKAHLNPKRLFEQITVNDHINFELKGLTTSVPMNSTKIDDANVIFDLTGHNTTQSMDLKHFIRGLNVSLPTTKKTDQPIAIKDVKWETKINIQLPQVFDPLPTEVIKLTEGNVATSLSAGEVTVDKVLKVPLKNTEFKTEFSLHKNRNVTLDTFHVEVPAIATDVDITSQAKLDEHFSPENFKVAMNLNLNQIPREFLANLDASGNVHVAVKAESTDMEEADLKGVIKLGDLNLNIPGKLKVAGVTGQLPLAQRVSLHQLKAPARKASPPALDQISDDDVRQVADAFLAKSKPPITGDTSVALSEDYGNFREFYADRKPITIKSIEASGLALNDLEIDAEVRQSEFALNNFIANFIGGKIQGNLVVAFSDQPVAVKAAVHATRLNTDKLIENIPGLKEHLQSTLVKSDPYIDGSLHLAYDLLNGDMLGGLNISSIGKDQMKTILYFIDPVDQDPTINAIKSALNFGEVKYVSVPIKNGEIGVDVDVRLISAPIPTPKLQGFPIAKIIQNMTAQDKKDDGESH